MKDVGWEKALPSAEAAGYACENDDDDDDDDEDGDNEDDDD